MILKIWRKSRNALHIVGDSEEEKVYFTEKNGDKRDFSTKPTLNKAGLTEEFLTDRLNMWIQNAGGYLYFYSHQVNENAKFCFDEWENHAYDIGIRPRNIHKCRKESILEADYKLKLYTVLSAHKPSESLPLVAPPAGTNPDWGALEKLVSIRLNKEYKDDTDESDDEETPLFDPRRSEKNKTYIKGIVKDYILFLQLKKDFNDYEASVLFSPSKIVDEVWHAHLSFVDRYQRDIMAFMGDAKLVEHEPVLGQAVKLRYATTFKALRSIHISHWSHGGWPMPQITVQGSHDDNDLDASYDSDG